jgi:hypothetical protein
MLYHMLPPATGLGVALPVVLTPALFGTREAEDH